MSEKDKMDIYEADYMQIPVDILTKENLDRLERHCKISIRYRNKSIKEEHELILALLYKYQDSILKLKNRLYEIQALYEENLKKADLKKVEKIDGTIFEGIRLEAKREILQELLGDE